LIVLLLLVELLELEMYKRRRGIENTHNPIQYLKLNNRK
jgi:hypothetical protein